MIYRGFRYEENDFSFYLDGSVIFTRESEDTVRYDLDLVTEFRFDVGVEPERTESKMSAICTLGAEGGARCTLEPGAAAKVAGLGGFSIEGFHQFDYTGEPGNTSELTLQGADSLFYEYVGAADCYTYTIEGGEPRNSCDEWRTRVPASHLSRKLQVPELRGLFDRAINGVLQFGQRPPECTLPRHSALRLEPL